jgi:hypothetical protein
VTTPTNQVPNGTIQQGQIWTPAQWNTAWQSKVDASGGFSTNETLTTPAINTPTINGVAISVPIPTYPQTASEIAAGVTPSNFTFPSPGIESGDLLRYGGTAPAIPNAVFFDGSQTQGVVGNGTNFATNLWFSNGTASSRTEEFASAFEYIASGGGTFNNSNSAFGVALFAGAKLTAGSRALFAFNSVIEVDTARQNQAYAIEADVANNSGADCNLSNQEMDQMGAILAGSGGSFAPLFAFQCAAASQAARFQVGASLTNWKAFGLQIVQDPVGVPAGATTAVTGPCIQMQASSNAGVQPIMRILNLAGSEVFQVLQSGQLQLANNIGLDFQDSNGIPQTALFVSPANNLFLACSPTGPGLGVLADQSLNVKFSWSQTGVGFFGVGPTARVTGYGTPTGGAHQASFAAGSITLTNLASAVAQLIIDLESYGIIGA